MWLFLYLAGLLLTRNRISNFAFFERLNYFQHIYNVDITGYGEDIRLPYIYLDDNEIRLLASLDEDFYLDGKLVSIRSYLYSFTTPRVRDFFKIPHMQVEEKKNNPFIKKLFKGNNKKKAAI